MVRHTDEQLLEVCRLSIAYLHDKHSTELGLFRSSVAQTDVRALQTQIIQFGQNKFRDDPDPHLVAEVLQTSFKNLTYPLLHEVYQDIVQTDLDDEDLDLSESSIQNWIVKLPKVKFHLTSALFRLLSRLAGIDESDSNLIQLAYCIAPSICRPINSAYMSIRHMEDLRKIRPVISFIMENYDEIFTDEIGPSSPIKAFNSARDLGGLGGLESFSYDKAEDISSMMSNSMVIDTGLFRSALGDATTDVRDDASMSSMDESVDDVPAEQKESDPNSMSPRSLALIRPNLKLTIPPPTMPTSFPASYDGPQSSSFSVSSAGSSLLGGNLDGDASSVSSVGSMLQHYTDAEWTILEALLVNTASTFLDFDSSRGEAMQVSENVVTPPNGPLPTGARPATPALTAPSSSSSSAGPHTAPGVGLHGGGGGAGGAQEGVSLGGSSISGASASNKNRRRKMVADCKAMRVQIFDFEQEWTRKHNRIPKSFERGAMETVYTRYRKLKKEIRDLSATDLQRAMRGYLSRKHHGRVGPVRWSQSEKSTIPAPAPAKASSTTKRADFSQNFFVPPGGNASAGAGGDGAFPGSNIPSGLYATYRDLLEKKRDLKRRLKKFDEDFFEHWGRNPKKSDKEVIRPMYQSYHEIKGKLDDMRASIESVHGPLPEDLQDEARVAGSSTPTSTVNSPGGPADTTGAVDAAAGAKYVSDDEDGESGRKGTYVSPRGGFPDKSAAGVGGVGAGGRSYVADMGEAKGYQFSVNKNPINVESELEALQIEKRNLHAYLKGYERDFSRMHGRPVTKHADIQPVAHEYQRYKELKNLIRDKKNNLTGAK